MQAIGDIISAMQPAINGPVPICPNCHTPSHADIAFGDNVMRMPVLCECEKRKLDEEEMQRKERDHMDKIQRLRANGMTDKAYRDWDFARDDGTNAKISKSCMNYVDEWKRVRAENMGLLFYGPVGTGKTFYACCIANAMIEKGVPALVTNFPRLLNGLQSGYDDKNMLIDSLQNYGLIVIDDLGAERNSSYGMEQIFNIVDARYRSGKPLIVTTNLAPADIKKPENIAYERIYDRILECCMPVLVDGPSRRIQKAESKRRELANLIGL